MPIRKIVTPIAAVSIDADILRMLRQIGYSSNEELINDLATPEPTMAKVFHAILTKNYDKASFPWRETPRIAPVLKLHWSDTEAPFISYEQEHTSDAISMDNANLFLVLQSMMNRFGFEWVHPDDMHLFVRTPDKEYVVIEAKYQDREFIRLRVRMDRGSDCVFTAIRDGINAEFGSVVPFTDDALNDGVPEMISV
jgi:hypothetical protein